jgi:predicted site-specific integrase-resolvase
MMTQVLDGFIEASELANQLRVSSRTIARWKERGLIFPSVRLGSRQYYNVDELRSKLRQMAHQPPVGRRKTNKGFDYMEH